MNNRFKIYIFSFFRMFLVIVPVIVPYFVNIGLSMKDVFTLQSIYGICVVLFKIPSGYISDLWGRKKSLLLGSFLTGIGYTYFIFANSFDKIAISNIIISIGFCFVSGADISLLYDSIDSNKKGHSTKSLANMQFFSVSGESIAAILGGILVSYSFKHVLIIHAIISWVPFFIALTFVEPIYKKMENKKHSENFKEVFKYFFLKSDKIFLLTFLNLIISGLSVFFAVWMFQKYWQTQSISITYFGIIWAAYSIFGGLIGKQVHHIEKKIGAIPLIAFLGLAPVAGYFIMGFTSGFISIVSGLLFYASQGITQVLLRDAMNRRIPSTYRATANSIHGFFFKLGFASLGPVVGILIDKKGINFTFITLGFIFLFTFLFFLVPLMKNIKNR